MKKMRQIELGKRSQITLFIILAIIIVGLLLIVFSTKIRTGIKEIFVSSSPSVKLQDCIQSKMKEAVTSVEKTGGSINPEVYYNYQGNKVEYLCYTNQYYETCVMQQPLLKQHVESEILNYIKPVAQQCYQDLKDNLASRGYSVSSSNGELSVSMNPGKVDAVVSGITVSKESSSEKYSEFRASYESNLYDLIMISESILNWEARYGDVDTTSYMSYYPSIKIEKLKQEDGSKIYILTKDTDKFVFATRSLSWPAGYGIGQTHKPTA